MLAEFFRGDFVRFLNQQRHRFSRLKLHDRRVPNTVARPLDQDSFDRLLASVLHPRDRIELKYMLMTLFCLLFAQFPASLVRLRRDALRLEDAQWQFRPAKIWLDLPSEVGRLLSKWLADRREQSRLDPTDASPYLFPGRVTMAGTSIEYFYDWLRSRGVRPKVLFSSGFANLCRHGLQYASVARDAYGIKSATACRYLSEFHPGKAEVAASEVRASCQKRKRSRSQ